MKDKITKVKDATYLFVEDEKDLTNILKELFSKLEIKTYFAENGQEALLLLEKHSDINIVTTDINMPIMNGYELLEVMNKKYSDKIKLVMSGNSSKYHDDRLRELGIDNNQVMPKPFDFIRYIKLIYNILHPEEQK